MGTVFYTSQTMLILTLGPLLSYLFYCGIYFFFL